MLLWYVRGEMQWERVAGGCPRRHENSTTIHQSAEVFISECMKRLPEVKTDVGLSRMVQRQRRKCELESKGGGRALGRIPLA